uniref:V-set and immunoglobulin domain-containing protein 8-like n=2 Tax=Sinocyclocheilus rhinocerous TaxID=307959 RepID=A0A673FXQ9_9TELE
MNKDNISVTVTDLKLQDYGRFSMVAEGKTQQYETKLIVLHVRELIRDVQIESSVSRLQSENICMFHLRCLASGGDLNLSYSWSGHQIQTHGSHLNISLRPAENTTLTCTANNTFSVKYATKTVVCTEKPDDSSISSDAGFPQKYLLIAVGVGIIVVVIFGGTLAVCCRCRNNKGQGESEAGITVYEDVNADATAKKRSESVVNGMSIYETVDDKKLSQNLPQTLYDKINYQRHPAVSASTSSPYQEVL